MSNETPTILEVGDYPAHPAPGSSWRWKLRASDTRLPEPVDLTWKWIPPGTSVMGARGYYEREEPVHEVIVDDGFWMLQTPVTQAQWLAVIGGENPAYEKNREHWRVHPVERISWARANEWCRLLDELSPIDTWRVELPSESQWEYACRAGSSSEYANGDGEERLGQVGWFAGNSRGRTHRVKQKKPNAWGLFDMHGNVLEWCRDAFESNAYHDRSDRVQAEAHRKGEDAAPRVLRGGVFACLAVDCRSAFRSRRQPDHEGFVNGFRACLFPGPIEP